MPSSALKTQLKEPHLPRQDAWLGSVPSHTLAPRPNQDLFETRIIFIPKQFISIYFLPGTLWLLFVCSVPAPSGRPSSLLCGICQLTSAFLKCFSTSLGLRSWFCSCHTHCSYSVSGWFLIFLPSVPWECPRAWCLDRVHSLPT